MDNLDSGKFGNQDLNEPIPFDKNLDVPIPFDDVDTSETGVSHSPLDLGGSDSGTAEEVKVEVPKPVAKKPAEKIVSTDRIVGIKTFFTKLHPGAMSFLDEQITKWLKENPDISIKQTNIVTGEIQAKKTEPNIIITVWY